MPNDLDGLLTSIIKRLNSDYKDDTIKEVLCFLNTSEQGLPEDECVSLFEVLKSKNIKIDRLLWANIIRSLNPLLKFTTNFNSKLVKLAHIRLHKVC